MPRRELSAAADAQHVVIIDVALAEKGSTETKSTVPAIVVLRPSMGKRVMVRMPDSPAVSFFQLSDLPAPSEVTTPMPVMTTIGLPNLSRGAVMASPSAPCPGAGLF